MADRIKYHNVSGPIHSHSFPEQSLSWSMAVSYNIDDDDQQDPVSSWDEGMGIVLQHWPVSCQLVSSCSADPAFNFSGIQAGLSFITNHARPPQCAMKLLVDCFFSSRVVPFRSRLVGVCCGLYCGISDSAFFPNSAAAGAVPPSIFYQSRPHHVYPSFDTCTLIHRVLPVCLFSFAGVLYIADSIRTALFSFLCSPFPPQLFSYISRIPRPFDFLLTFFTPHTFRGLTVS
ncbi:uncharacterized protein An13g02890 [Aspergillus niger]|uniref:Contig An13c0080, genomic contig n=2 Tax=Aspergillus niger TaxID=5061 RepID=A2R1Y5_ASPNC|nr:uncharacterized protein An13g02890 [Aspergillus niger]CAK41685.1 unnamed protein product [Aspergillus niger]